MRVRRSLTIKQMAVVSSVTLVTICIFIVIQLFHLVQQRRDDYVQQLENIAHTVRQPLAEAVMRIDVPATQKVLNSLLDEWILTRADVVLHNEYQALRADFPPERQVPAIAARIFELPVQISVPLSVFDPDSAMASPQPQAYLVLQADSFRLYQFILSTLSALLSAYFLLVLTLSVAITWCMNRLLVYPLRAIVRELESISEADFPYHQLRLPARHRDDELGLLVRNYNRHHQMLSRANVCRQSTPDFSPVKVSVPHEENEQASLLALGLTEEVREQLAQESVTLLALKQHRFALFLQPQFDMQTRQIIGAEALLRWQKNDGSFALSAQLIPLAESLSVIVPLGNWVLEESCRILAEWRNRNIPLPLAVNISVIQLQHRDFVPHLKQLLAQHQLDPGKLQLEITETAHIDDFDCLLLVLRELHDMGLSIILDDFGMGYSSLEYLSRLKCLPIGLIKIDKSFVSTLPHDDAMVRIIISIAEVLNLPMIAEGIETETQCEWLLRNGIRNGQGFLFAKPLPREVFEAQFGQSVQ